MMSLNNSSSWDPTEITTWPYPEPLDEYNTFEPNDSLPQLSWPQDTPPLTPESSESSPPKFPTSTHKHTLPHPQSAPTKPAPPKHSHSVIERRYRQNLNTRIADLRQLVQSLYSDTDNTTAPTAQQRTTLSDRSPDGDEFIKREMSKAEIVELAVAQIRAQSDEQERLEQEARMLDEEERELSKLVKCEHCPLVDYIGGGLDPVTTEGALY